MEVKKLKKNLPRFFCEPCDFKCYMKCDWDRHITRPKHIASLSGNLEDGKKLKKTYYCDCGRIFLSNSGLWKHKKGCGTEELHTIDDNNDKDLIMMLVKQNSELLEVIKNGTHNTTNSHNNTNSNNKYSWYNCNYTSTL